MVTKKTNEVCFAHKQVLLLFRPTQPPKAGGSKVKILGRYRNVIVKGRVQWAMYKGELVKISELRKIEKDLIKL